MVDVTGGGDLAALGVKHVSSVVDTGTTYGVATYGQPSYGGHSPDLLLRGGGTPVATGSQPRPFVLDGGGDGAMSGHRGVTGIADLSGGGHLWGPFPFALDPGVRIVTPSCQLQVRVGENKVSRRRGDGDDLVLQASVRVTVH